MTGAGRPAATVNLAGWPVRRIGFGALRVLGPYAWGPPSRPDQAARVLKAASDRCDLIDVADCYGPGIAETLIGQHLAPYRDGLVVATKGGQTCRRPGEWRPAGHPLQLAAACEASLRRLRTDCIDLYQLHTIDPQIPLEESLGALVDLRERGLIRTIGICNVNHDQLLRAVAITPLASVQNRCSVLDRDDSDIVEYCSAQSIVYMAWYPLVRGEAAHHPELVRLARSTLATPAQLALAWLLHRSPALIPIPGTGSIKHLEENANAAAVVLASDEYHRLSAISTS